MSRKEQRWSAQVERGLRDMRALAQSEKEAGSEGAFGRGGGECDEDEAQKACDDVEVAIAYLDALFVRMERRKARRKQTKKA